MITKERLDEIKKFTDSLVDKSLKEIADENKIKVIVWDLSDMGVSWAIAKINDEIYDYSIFINSKDANVRQRFTFAHELGHFFLHKDKLAKDNLIVDNSWVKYLFRYKDLYNEVPEENREMEESADEFAWNLLMPEKKVRELWLRTNNIWLLAEAFDVSIQAMSYRIYKLNLKDVW